jgi:hypothetical protein
MINMQKLNVFLNILLHTSIASSTCSQRSLLSKLEGELEDFSVSYCVWKRAILFFTWCSFQISFLSKYCRNVLPYYYENFSILSNSFWFFMTTILTSWFTEMINVILVWWAADGRCILVDLVIEIWWTSVIVCWFIGPFSYNSRKFLLICSWK